MVEPAIACDTTARRLRKETSLSPTSHESLASECS
jgi:hypothetical protein